MAWGRADDREDEEGPFLSQLTLTPSPEVSPSRRNWRPAEPASCAHSTASHLLPHKTKKSLGVSISVLSTTLDTVYGQKHQRQVNSHRYPHRVCVEEIKGAAHRPAHTTTGLAGKPVWVPCELRFPPWESNRQVDITAFYQIPVRSPQKDEASIGTDGIPGSSAP